MKTKLTSDKPVSNKLTFKIEKLEKEEHHGDWHDAPTKWIAECSDKTFTQKFSTRKNAELWARISKKSTTFNEAYNKFLCHEDRC